MKPGCGKALKPRGRTAGLGTRSPSPWVYLGKRRGSGSSTRQTPDRGTRGGRACSAEGAADPVTAHAARPITFEPLRDPNTADD